MPPIVGMNSPVTRRASGIAARARGAGKNSPSSSYGIAPLFTARTPPDGQQGVAYTYTFVATGTPAPIFEVSAGTLPTGLTLNATTGVLAGTPSAAATYAFTVRAYNSTYPAVEAAESVIIAAP